MLTVHVARALNGKRDFHHPTAPNHWVCLALDRLLQRSFRLSGRLWTHPASPRKLQRAWGRTVHPAAGFSDKLGPPGKWQYLAVLAAIPPGTLSSLSQLASCGIATAVRALLQDRDTPKPSREPPERPFSSFLGGPNCHVTRCQWQCSRHRLNHGAKAQHHSRCEPFLPPLYPH